MYIELHSTTSEPFDIEDMVKTKSALNLKPLITSKLYMLHNYHENLRQSSYLVKTINFFTNE